MTNRRTLAPRLCHTRIALAVLAGLCSPGLQTAAAQDRQERDDRFPGSAVVTVGDQEYTIRIECRQEGRPEAGFITEANRITRRETGGRYNMVTLRLRPWKDTSDVLVSFEAWMAWIPTPASADGVLSLAPEMSPVSLERDGERVLLTYDMWQAGDRPEGRDDVRFVADCTRRDPKAPAFRKVGG